MILLHDMMFCKVVRQFLLPARTVNHTWLLLRLSMIFCFLHRLVCMKNGFLPRLPHDSASCWVSAGSLLSLSRKQIHANSLGRKPFFGDGCFGKKQEIWLAKVKYDCQSKQEGEIDRLVYTLFCRRGSGYCRRGSGYLWNYIWSELFRWM